MEYICPLCNSSNSIVYLKADRFDILRCNNCTNARTNPPPGTIKYEDLDFHLLEISKSDQSPKTYEGLPVPWKKDINRQIKLITKHIPAGASILEIGCGEGIFLSELKKNGYSTTGIEPSVTASKRANDNGLKVLQGYFPNNQLKNKKFDLIIMCHVLEHIKNIDEVFSAFKDNLNEKGKILFIQTNYLGIIPKFKGEKWYPWVFDQHFWHFTPKGISVIAKKYCFKELEREYSSLVHITEKKSWKNVAMFFFDNLIPRKYRDQFHIILELGTNKE